jgi:hypothetical protein
MKLVITIIVMISFYSHGFSASVMQGDSLVRELVKQNKQTNTILTKVASNTDTLKKELRTKAPVNTCIDCTPPHEFFRWLLVFLPVILFVLLLWYFLRWMKKDGFKIADALSVDMTDEQVEDLQRAALAPQRRAIDAPPGAPDTPPQTPEPVLKRSSSRLIAFFSGLAAVIIGICITSYYMYFAMRGATVPKFEDLWPILASLGIGVIPYATKVINEKK